MGAPPDGAAGLQTVAGWIADAGHVAALTGAGISTESGIPDFRGPDGVWTKDPAAERLSTLQTYLADPEVRRLVWRMRLEHPARRAQPNAGHLALVELERRGRLHTLITQNIDGLHLAAGSSPAVVIELHGNLREVVCMSCGERSPMEPALERVRAGEEDPACAACGGILKSATISFGQSLVPEDLDRARRAARASDLFIALGTSLAVYPVAHLPEEALAAGARLVIVNAAPTPYDDRAHAVIREQIGTVMPALVRRV